jgi:hypothetical protein
MGITYASDTNVTIKQDYQRLAEIDAAISELYAKITTIVATGQEYTLFGSRQIKNPLLADINNAIDGLEKQKAKYEKRVLYAKGFTGQNNADHSGRGVGQDPGDVD